MASPRSDVSVRERLLAAADDLFYEEGVHSVGIDRVLAHAGVAKASLYGTFGSKDELVRAYLEERGRRRRERISNRIAQSVDPRERILCIFDALGEVSQTKSFRGCPFVNACAEGRGDATTPARQVSADQRGWMHNLFIELATDLGARDPAQLGRRLSLVYDGAVIAAWMDSDPGAPVVARQVAEGLLDAEVAVKALGARAAKPVRKRSTRAR
jgi:AcrR family transcriptional regulator